MGRDRQALTVEIQESFRQLTWLGRQRLSVNLERFDLTVPQYLVLTKLNRLGGRATMSAVCDAIQVPRSSMTGIADRLVERGLIDRSPFPDDRRAVAVAVTPAGADLIGAVEALSAADLNRVVEPMPTEQLASLAETLSALLDGFAALPTDADALPSTRFPSSEVPTP